MQLLIPIGIGIAALWLLGRTGTQSDQYGANGTDPHKDANWATSQWALQRFGTADVGHSTSKVHGMNWWSTTIAQPLTPQLHAELDNQAKQISSQHGNAGYHITQFVGGVSRKPITSITWAIDPVLGFQDSVGQAPQQTAAYGAVPPPPAAAASGASVLKSAGLAAPGSWTRRNVLQAGAASAYERRLAGTATEADYAVLRAARPGIASGQSGYISPAWTGAPWQPGPGLPPGPRGGLFSEALSEEGADDIGDLVAEEMFAGASRIAALRRPPVHRMDADVPADE